MSDGPDPQRAPGAPGERDIPDPGRGQCPAVDVVPARAGDLRELVRLEGLLFPEDPWTEGMLREELASASSHYLIARADGTACGYGGVKVLGDQGDIMTIGVVPGARGRSVGSRLLDGLIAWARRAGADELFLDVRASNAAAIGLYLSRGFEAVGRRRRYFRNPVEDALVMRLAGLAGGPAAHPSN
ncbi:ribosomal protein S18-alanine N-acetyltransferase [Schaalia georgiae]|uniref:ribosomal protein S18-alanine N-acetyltransferase n=1 Tax=Schaalia georgiae TaxID=52768 RepID=UPI000409A55A|nr:ribosomal protein S18-alanine N-acetyltransferase [Schaalia georgiae]